MHTMSVEMHLPVTTVVDLHLQMQDRIREAADTLRRMDNTDRKFLAAGEKCSWPAYVRDWHAYGAEDAREPRIPPTNAAIDRMNETIGWIAWLATQSRDEAIVVWFSFGAMMRTKTLARRIHANRETVRRKRKAGIQRLLERFGLALR